MDKIDTIENESFNLAAIKDDRKFEELIDKLFQYRIKDDLSNTYDGTLLMPGVGEKGRDIILLKDGHNSGVIQCKLKDSGNLDKTSVAKEIIKFCLHSLKDKTLIYDISVFNYYLICSKNFSSPAISLLDDFNKKILIEEKLNIWIEDIISKYEEFKGFNYSRDSLIQRLTNIKIKSKNYNHINNWLNNYKPVAEEYFKMKHVIDRELLKESVKDLVDNFSKEEERKQIDFVKKYLIVAKKHLDKVPFIGHSVGCIKPQNVTVTKLYVEPDLNICNRKEQEIKDSGETENKKAFKVNDILKSKKNKHLVILGDPGAGKSLLIKNIILNLISKKNTLGYRAYEGWIPIRIELRKYNSNKIKHSINITEYIAFMIKNEYQINNVDEKFVDKLIQNNNVIIFFDGLDEVFDKTHKNYIRDDIVNFSQNYTHVKCIITSRFVGYDDNPFPDETFIEYSITNFTQSQIDKFINNFYGIMISDRSTREHNTNNLTRQLKSIEPQLKSNPLILSLISILALNNSTIPESKLDIYKACTETLVNTFDKNEKELDIKLKVRDKNGVFGFLGYWQYCKMTEDRKINRVQIKHAISEHLIERKEFIGFNEAGEAVDDFLDYAEARSIYFDNNFMHKTFLEYYAANYILLKYHNGEKKEERDKILNKYIDNISWHIVFELLFVMIDKQVYDDDILGVIINRILLSNITLNKILFTTSIFTKLTNIDNDTKYKILLDSIIFILNFDYQKEEFKSKNTIGSIFTFIKVAISKDEFLKEKLKDVEVQVEEQFKSEKKISMYYSILHELEFFDITNVERYNQLIDKDLCLYTYCRIQEKDSIFEQIEKFGIMSIFSGASIPFLGNANWVPAIDLFFNNSNFNSYEVLVDDFKKLTSLGLNSEILEKKYMGSIYNYESSQTGQKVIKLADFILTKPGVNIVNTYISLVLGFIPKQRLKRYLGSEVYESILKII